MNAVSERRRHVRKVGQGLIAIIDGKAHPIINISSAGLSYQGSGPRPGAVVSLTLARIDDTDDCIGGTITVVSSENGIIRGEFRPTMPLLTYVISHIGEATGAAPAYFRR